MKRLVLLFLLVGGPALADPAETLCRTNPALSPDVMLRVVQALLEMEEERHHLWRPEYWGTYRSVAPSALVCLHCAFVTSHIPTLSVRLTVALS